MPLYFPRGIYLITGNIITVEFADTLPLKVFGDGSGISIIKCNGNFTGTDNAPIVLKGNLKYVPVPAFEQQSRCAFDKLEFDGNDKTLQSGFFLLKFAAHVDFWRCWWRRCKMAILGFQWWDSHFNECHWIKCGTAPVAPDPEVPCIQMQNGLRGTIQDSGDVQDPGGAPPNNEVILDTSAHGSDGFYDGWEINIVAGPGSGDTRTMSNYSGTTKKATVSPVWTTIPTTASDYEIPYPGGAGLSNNIHFNHCRWEECPCGVRIGKFGRKIWFTNCKFDRVSEYAIKAQEAEAVFVIACHCVEADDGLLFTDSADCVVVGGFYSRATNAIREVSCERNVIVGVRFPLDADEDANTNNWLRDGVEQTPLDVPTAPIAITLTVPSGTNDGSIQALVNTGGWGFKEQAEGETVLRIVKNVFDRLGELEIALRKQGVIE